MFSYTESLISMLVREDDRGSSKCRNRRAERETYELTFVLHCLRWYCVLDTRLSWCRTRVDDRILFCVAVIERARAKLKSKVMLRTMLTL